MADVRELRAVPRNAQGLAGRAPGRNYDPDPSQRQGRLLTGAEIASARINVITHDASYGEGVDFPREGPRDHGRHAVRTPPGSQRCRRCRVRQHDAWRSLRTSAHAQRRMRHLWPFASLLVVALACLAAPAYATAPSAKALESMLLAPCCFGGTLAGCG